MPQALALFDTVLTSAGYRTERLEARFGVLGEDASRIVWAVAFPAVTALLERWEEEQAWLVEITSERVSVEKSWELYLVLACDPVPDEHEAQALAGVHRDVAYARKLVVPGMAGMSPSRLRDRLAPLEELALAPTQSAPDGFALLQQRAEEAGVADALTVLGAYRDNRPLFERL